MSQPCDEVDGVARLTFSIESQNNFIFNANNFEKEEKSC